MKQNKVWMLFCVTALFYTACEDPSPPQKSTAVEFGENFVEEGRNVVPPDAALTYATDPPTSGSFFTAVTAPGFYTSTEPAGRLMHALFRSGVVVFYDPSVISASDRLLLQVIAERYRDLFAGVIAVPRADLKFPLIATAWTHRLRLDSFDEGKLQRFIDLYRGHGPMIQAGPEIEAYVNEGRDHLPVGTPLIYKTDPPTSGNHYPWAADNRFYISSNVPAMGYLVHALEHSNIEIWYDESRLTIDEMAALKTWVESRPDPFKGLIGLPRQDAQYPIVMTAWQYCIRLPSFDRSRMQAFIDLYIGKGPEQKPHTDH